MSVGSLRAILIPATERVAWCLRVASWLLEPLPARNALRVGFRSKGVRESRVLAVKGQSDGSGRTIAVFSDDDLGQSGVRRVLVVVVVPIQEQDDVRVLLDGARFSEIGHDRSLVGALLKAAIEL